MHCTQQDLIQRLKATLPLRWFGEITPVLDTVLNSLAAGWFGLFNLLAHVRAQTRLQTASDDSLDLIAKDYCGRRLLRRSRESDTSFRIRIHQELLRDKCTRSALYEVLFDLTGRPPTIFEPANPADTGSYGSIDSSEPGNASYGFFGGWGSLNSPFQTFVKASMPRNAAIAMINGWGGDIGAYGTGFSSYVSSTANSPCASGSEVCAAVARIAPAGSIIWMSLDP